MPKSSSVGTEGTKTTLFCASALNELANKTAVKIAFIPIPLRW
jgi:hypothetical protein